MAAPTIRKSWTVNANNQIPFANFPGQWNERVTQRSKLWLAIKNMFVALGWRVTRSCGIQRTAAPWSGDGVVHLGNSDNIPDWQHAAYDGQGTSPWPAPGNPHAWVVLQPPISLGVTWAFIFEYESEDWLAYEGSAGNSFYATSKGYDLSTGTGPYPPKEVDWGGSDPYASGYHGPFGWRKVGWSPGYWGVAGYSCYDETVHGIASADGRQLRVWACAAGVVHWAFTFDYLDSPVPSSSVWPQPVVWSWFAYGTAITRDSGFPWGESRLTGNAVVYTSFANGANVGCYLTGEGYGGATAGQNVWGRGDFTGLWELNPVSVWSNGGTNNRGRLGTLTDTWWAPYGLIDGTLLSTPDERRLAVINNWVVPWNSASVPLYGEYGQGR